MPGGQRDGARTQVVEVRNVGIDAVDPLLATPIKLSEREFEDLVKFVGKSLLDDD